MHVGKQSDVEVYTNMKLIIDIHHCNYSIGDPEESEGEKDNTETTGGLQAALQAGQGGHCVVGEIGLGEPRFGVEDVHEDADVAGGSEENGDTGDDGGHEHSVGEVGHSVPDAAVDLDVEGVLSDADQVGVVHEEGEDPDDDAQGDALGFGEELVVVRAVTQVGVAVR